MTCYNDLFATSFIELSHSALSNNISWIKHLIGPNVELCCVVKGNAYGHGIEQFVPLAEQCGIHTFSVFSAHEAWRVLNTSFNDPRIIIMGNCENEQIDWAIENGVEFYVFDHERLGYAIEAGKKLKKQPRVHVQVETGMNRTGFTRRDLSKVAQAIRSGQVRFAGLCTHLAGAESIANYVRIKDQFRRYRRIEKWFETQGLVPNIRHVASSAATVIHPDMRLDMVRVGILLYGLWPSRETYIYHVRNRKSKEDPLRRVISWKSRIMNTKKVKTGEFIGYGTSFLAQDDLEIASVPVGYGHGFSRSLSNSGRVLVHGHRVSVVGVVNMNMMMINVSDIDHVRKGEEVVLIGRQEDLEISIASFGEFSDQMNYELLTRLPMNIPRIVTD